MDINIDLNAHTESYFRTRGKKVIFSKVSVRLVTARESKNRKRLVISLGARLIIFGSVNFF
jgi:hypothetical protein